MFSVDQHISYFSASSHALSRFAHVISCLRTNKREMECMRGQGNHEGRQEENDCYNKRDLDRLSYVVNIHFGAYIILFGSRI